MHKHARLGGSGVCPPGNFYALRLLLRPFWDKNRASSCMARRVREKVQYCWPNSIVGGDPLKTTTGELSSARNSDLFEPTYLIYARRSIYARPFIKWKAKTLIHNSYNTNKQGLFRVKKYCASFHSSSVNCLRARVPQRIARQCIKSFRVRVWLRETTPYGPAGVPAQWGSLSIQLGQ